MILSDTLILIRPDCLLTTYQLGDSKDNLYVALKLFQKALDEHSYSNALLTINQALEILEPLEIIESNIANSNTGLKQWEIDDFDNFFGLKHIEAENPANCLVSSLIKGYQTLLKLSNVSDCESYKFHIEAQKNGLRTCLELFFRVFDLT